MVGQSSTPFDRRKLGPTPPFVNDRVVSGRLNGSGPHVPFSRLLNESVAPASSAASSKLLNGLSGQGTRRAVPVLRRSGPRSGPPRVWSGSVLMDDSAVSGIPCAGPCWLNWPVRSGRMKYSHFPGGDSGSGAAIRRKPMRSGIRPLGGRSVAKAGKRADSRASAPCPLPIPGHGASTLKRSPNWIANSCLASDQKAGGTIHFRSTPRSAK